MVDIHPYGTSIHVAHPSIWHMHPCGPVIHVGHPSICHMDGWPTWMGVMHGWMSCKAEPKPVLTPILRRFLRRLTPSYANLPKTTIESQGTRNTDSQKPQSKAKEPETRTPKNHNRKPRNQKHRPKSKGGGVLEPIIYLEGPRDQVCGGPRAKNPPKPTKV